MHMHIAREFFYMFEHQTFCQICMYVLFAACNSFRWKILKRNIQATPSANFTNIELGECMTKCFDRVTCISFTRKRFSDSSSVILTRCDLYDSLQNAIPDYNYVTFYDKICSTGTYNILKRHLWSFVISSTLYTNVKPSLL